MPETTTVAIKKTTDNTGVMVASGALIVGGIALVIFSRGKERIDPLPPGEKLEKLTAAALEGKGPIQVVRGQQITIVDPTVYYLGPGRDTYTYFQVKQTQNGVLRTVQGSGVAGVRVGPATTLTPFHLVAADQPQPEGCPERGLCAYVWPGPPCDPPDPECSPTPICGSPPQAGYADAYLEIYQRLRPQDHDGYASPTCNGRIPVAQLKLTNKILYR